MSSEGAHGNGHHHGPTHINDKHLETAGQNGGFAGATPLHKAVTPGGHPQDATQPAFPIYHRRFANPAPLGLFGFAATTFMLSLFNIGARGISSSNGIIGMAIAYGGTAQFIAGVWEFACGNTFGATAFCSYGAFWWSFAITLIPFFGVSESAASPSGVPEAQLRSVLAIYLASWFVFTFIMFVASFRSSVGLVTLFFFLDVTFLLLFISDLIASGGNTARATQVETAGGAFGIITAAIAWYVGTAGLLTPDTSFFTLPVISLARDD